MSTVDGSSKTNYLKISGLSLSAFLNSSSCMHWFQIPVSSISVERSFLALCRIHTYCRNTQGQQRLSNLSVLAIEKKLLKLKSSENEEEFYSLVIDEFIKKEKWIELAFKWEKSVWVVYYFTVTYLLLLLLLIVVTVEVVVVIVVVVEIIVDLVAVTVMIVIFYKCFHCYKIHRPPLLYTMQVVGRSI